MVSKLCQETIGRGGKLAAFQDFVEKSIKIAHLHFKITMVS